MYCTCTYVFLHVKYDTSGCSSGCSSGVLIGVSGVRHPPTLGLQLFCLWAMLLTIYSYKTTLLLSVPAQEEQKSIAYEFIKCNTASLCESNHKKALF